jgi:hypothetical protein
MEMGYFSRIRVETIYLVKVVEVKNEIMVPSIVVMANPFTGPVPN